MSCATAEVGRFLVDPAARRIPISTRAEAVIKGARFWGVDYDGATHAAGDGEAVVLQAAPRAGLRLAAKQVLAAPSTLALWQASRAEPQLSRDARLSERKERLYEVLDGVRRDYL